MGLFAGHAKGPAGLHVVAGPTSRNRSERGVVGDGAQVDERLDSEISFRCSALQIDRQHLLGRFRHHHGRLAVAIRDLLGEELGAGGVRELRIHLPPLVEKKSGRGLPLVLGRRSAIGPAVGLVDRAVLVASRFLVEPQGHGLRTEQHELAVDQQQRLDGRGRRVAGRGAGEILRGVEHVEQRIAVVAEDLRVDRTVELRAVHGGSDRFLLELARRGKERVADLLGVETADVGAPMEAVFRIDKHAALPALRCGQDLFGIGGFAGILRRRGRLPVNRRGEDEPVKFLDAPAIGHETTRHPVEQFRMGGLFTEPAEVAAGRDKALAEVVLPDAVDHHAGAERILRVGQPPGQLGAAPSRLRRGRNRMDVGRPLEKKCEITGIDHLVAFAWNRHRSGLGTDVAHGVGDGQRSRLGLIERGQLLAEGGGLLLVLRLHLGRETVEFVVDLPVGQLGDLVLVDRPFGLGFPDQGLDVLGELADGLIGRLHLVGPFDLFDLLADVSGQVLPFDELVGVVEAVFGIGGGHIFTGYDAGEEGLEPVVVLLEDGIELVVVATRALHAETEEDITRRVGDVVQDGGPLPARVAVVVFVDPMPEVARGDQGIGLIGEKFIAGQLLLDEAVVGLVGVERAYDIVAVAPGLRTKVVDAVSVRIGIAHQIKPMAGPSLAIARAGKKLIDQLLVGIRRFVGDERIDLLRRRRHAPEVEVEPSDQDAAGRLAVWLEFVVRELLEDEPIDVGPRPARVGHLGRLHLLDRLEGPPLPVLVGDLALGPLGHATARGTGPRRALLDPFLQHGHLILGQPLALGRHLLLRVGRSDAGHHLTVVGFAGDDGGLARFTALEDAGKRVEDEGALDLAAIVAVALEAFLGQERADLLLEKLGLLGRRLSRLHGGGQERGQCKTQAGFHCLIIGPQTTCATTSNPCPPGRSEHPASAAAFHQKYRQVAQGTFRGTPRQGGAGAGDGLGKTIEGDQRGTGLQFTGPLLPVVLAEVQG